MLGGKNDFRGKPERVFPKGLDPERSYLVESADGKRPAETRTGADWMRDGIWVEESGESLYLNLADRPGTGEAMEAPMQPKNVTVTKEHWLQRDGAMILWDEIALDAPVSYAEIRKNGELLEEVASGHGWFDETYREGDVYTVRFMLMR